MLFADAIALDRVIRGPPFTSWSIVLIISTIVRSNTTRDQTPRELGQWSNLFVFQIIWPVMKAAV